MISCFSQAETRQVTIRKVFFCSLLLLYDTMMDDENGIEVEPRKRIHVKAQVFSQRMLGCCLYLCTRTVAFRVHRLLCVCVFVCLCVCVRVCVLCLCVCERVRWWVSGG